MEHWQQLDGRDAEFLKIGNFLDKAGVSPASCFRNSGARMAREASHMHLVNDRSRGWRLKRSVAFPIVRPCIHYYALHRCRSAVTFASCCFPAVILGNSHAAPVRVEEDLVGIEPHAVGGVEWPMNAICVKLSRSQILYEYVPIVVRAVGRGIDRD